MKTLPKIIWMLVLVVFGALASSSAMAQHRGHGFSRGHSHGGHARIGISLGIPVFAASYYYSPYYAHPAFSYRAPVYVYPSAEYRLTAPVEYVERGVAQAPPSQTQAQTQGQTAGYWYYCTASATYYPYVNECPSGWQRVPAQPPNR